MRAYLRRFLFTDDRINTKITQLSGGERSRVLLAKILKRGGNLLILDEPPTISISDVACARRSARRFPRCVIVVSHDRYFLNRVCTAILAFESDGRVVYHVGTTITTWKNGTHPTRFVIQNLCRPELSPSPGEAKTNR